MFEMLERLILRLREVWAKMTLNQKVVTGGVLAALLLSSLYISTLSQRMIRYTVLIAQLDAVSTNEIITNLEQQNIPYRITQGGTAVEVPAELADRLKIQFAAQGLLERGIVGYEILDTTNFGMSDFLQKVNYKRALEGELGRTLRTLDAVEFARVHLVIPEPSLYTETAEPPTASVVISLKRGKSLTPQSVEAIANLAVKTASPISLLVKPICLPTFMKYSQQVRFCRTAATEIIISCLYFGGRLGRLITNFPSSACRGIHSGMIFAIRFRGSQTSPEFLSISLKI